MNALSWPLRLYVGAVIAAAALALALGALWLGPLTSIQLAAATVLLSLAWASQRYPVHLGPKIKVTVDDAPLFAAALLLPPFVAMAIAGLSNAFGLRFSGKVPLYNRFFNAAAALLSTGAAAVAFGVVARDVDVVEEPLAMLVAAVLPYLLRAEI